MRSRTWWGIVILIAVYAARASFRDVADVAPSDVPPSASPAARGVASEGRATPPVPRAKPAPAARPAARSRADETPEQLLARKPGRGPRGTDDPQAPPMERFDAFKMSGKLAVGRRGYRVLGARAIRPERYSSALGPVMFEEFGRRVVAYQADGWGDLTTFADGHPLLVNPANGRLALVTGTIEVSLPSVEAAEALANTENLTLLKYDRAIGLAFLKAPAEYALIPALTRIGARPGVGGVELELVESRKVAQ